MAGADSGWGKDEMKASLVRHRDEGVRLRGGEGGSLSSLATAGCDDTNETQGETNLEGFSRGLMRCNSLQCACANVSVRMFRLFRF